MSRAIKFRAWISDCEDPLMFYPGSDEPYTITSNGDGFGLVYDLEDWLPEDQFTVMQFTGLHDKNGVEIYEGDICRTNWNDERYKPKIAVIEWNAADACWSVGAGVPSEVSWSHEVIGNIHQNPELLP